jgi:undecaprenyl-diphosphatase
MLQTLITFDSAVSGILANLLPHNAFFDAVFSFLSLSGFTFIIWILFFIAYLVFEETRDKKFIIYFLLSFFTTAIIVNYVLKNVFMRERPYVTQNLSVIACPRDYSFPSGHAAGAFAGAVIFARFDKKRRWYYYSTALLISYSRIYLHCHYLFDVIFGALVGFSVSKAYIIALAHRIIIKDVLKK